MNRFAWRQYRKQFLIFFIFLALFAAVLIPTGLHFWHTYQTAVSTCQQHPATPNCSDMQNSLFQGDGAIIDTVILGVFGAPMLLGIFLGSPLLAREYEEGTNKLVWSQSVSRRKWLSVKLLWALGFTFLYGVAIAILATWWMRTINSLQQSRFDTGMFDIQGMMPAVYSVFFTAVGFTMGAWFRKSLVAMAVTLGVIVLCLATFGEWIRPHYMTPITITSPMGPGFSENIPKGAWVLTHNMVDINGRVIGDVFTSAPPQCQQIIQQNQVTDNNGRVGLKIKAGNGNPIDSCLNAAGWHLVAKYQPSYRYWDFQRIESSIYVGLTALAVGATYWLVLKRDA
jgi:ABC-2 family transporter protein